jgi:hypothetical protein
MKRSAMRGTCPRTDDNVHAVIGNLFQFSLLRRDSPSVAQLSGGVHDPRPHARPIVFAVSSRLIQVELEMNDRLTG